MALTANRELDHYIDQELRSLQVRGGAHVYKGSFIGLDANGYARPLVAGDAFAGIAYEEMDNSGGADGAVSVRVYTLGDFGVTLSGATVAHVGRPVFASDDATATFTAAGNSYLGVVEDVPASGEIILRIDPGRTLIKTVTHVVEDLAAGVDIATRAIHVFQAEAWVTAARVVNQASAASGIDNSNPCVVVVATGAGTVATTTFSAATPFPAPNTSFNLGTITNPNAAAGSVLTLSVTNGTTANTGPFLVEVDYV